MGRPSHRLLFGPFTLDPHSLELTEAGHRVPLPPQPARVLTLLASHAGDLVTREEIREHVWGDQAVEFDTGLHSCIRQIRRALSDDTAAPSYVETVPRRGYRFIAQVSKQAVTSLVMPASPAAPVPRDLPDLKQTPGGWGRIAAGAIAAVLLAFVVMTLAPRRAPASRGTEPRAYRLVVLPFDNLLIETDPDASLVPAFDEEIRTELSRLDPGRLGVVARASSQRLADGDPSVAEIGQQLDVTHVLEGAVRRVNGGLAITARLVSVDGEVQVWADRFVKTGGDIDFALDVAQRVASRLVPELLPALERHEHSRPNIPPEAQRATLEARYLLQQGESAAAHDRLDTVLELAPDYALAHALLAEALTHTSDWDAAEVAALRALELDPGQARANRVLGDVELYGRLQISAAGPWYRNASNLAPTDPDILMAWGWWLIASGDTDAALGALRTALLWDPVSPVLHGDGPWFYFFAHRLDEAIAESRRGMELLPELQTAKSCQIAVALVRRDFNEMTRLVGAPSPDSAVALDTLDAAKRNPPPDAFERFVRRNIEALTNSPSAPNRFSRLARLHAFVDEPEQAFAALEQALAEREVDLIFLATDPRLDGLRNDPRFDAVLVGLAEHGS